VELLTQALTIMSVGMVLVFVFLTAVIGGIAATARLIRRYEARLAAAAVPATDAEAERLVVVIAVALNEHAAGR
jgi:Na+-transporting methylmalonyl-CoA/oxaloacetate decarboxylase gamma subunit